MSSRNTRRSAGNGNAIRGPQSALTDFLASHNISAHQISVDYQRRVREAEGEAGPSNAGEEGHVSDAEEPEDPAEDPVERKKRKRKEEKAIAAIKASKEFKKRKHDQSNDSDAEDDDDALARRMLKKPKSKAQPKPGQFAHCEECEKRFTVTPYNIAGPAGGLLCTKCSKDLKSDKKKADAAAAKKKVVSRGRKRQTESDRLMGDVKPGAKSLVDHCIKKVVNVVNDVEDFGDLPQNLLDRLSQILSKQRVINSRTMQLFLRPEIDRIAIYDCGKLETDDFRKIFAYMPDVERVNLRFAGQMKDDPLLYMIEKNPKITHLQLGATNLISDDAWVQLFVQRGPQLESLKLSELNDSLGDDSVQVLGQHCINLKRLKLRSCFHVGERSLAAISGLTKLEHLSLSVAQNSSSETLVNLITKVGPSLLTLSLEGYNEADDSVIEAVKDNCAKLQKLRFTGSSACSDQAFANLFSPSRSVPSLKFVDLSDNRDIDSRRPDGYEDDPVGFGSEALRTLMQHSGQTLERLDLHSCRHIGHKALIDVFDGEKQYPNLQDVDLSFVTNIDEAVMMGIFKSCPKLQKLAVFACFSARSARIPVGIAVIGLPNAQENVVTEGDATGL